MIVAGDEVRRTQQGNNNAYCHDSELNWFDWRLVGANAGLLRFFSRLIGNRRRHAELHRARFFTGEVNERGLADISWHGCNLHEPGFDDPTTGVLAFTLGGADEGTDLHAMLNMEDTALDFELLLRRKSAHPRQRAAALAAARARARARGTALPVGPQVTSSRFMWPAPGRLTSSGQQVRYLYKPRREGREEGAKGRTRRNRLL